MAIHRAIARRGHGFTQQELAEMELAYIGGLLGLDIQVDQEAREKAFTGIKNKRRASPDRKG